MFRTIFRLFSQRKPPLSNLEQPWATSNRLQRAVDDLRSWFCSVLGASRPWLIEASSVLQHAISMAQHFNFWSETIYLSLLDPHSCIPLFSKAFRAFQQRRKGPLSWHVEEKGLGSGMVFEKGRASYQAWKSVTAVPCFSRHLWAVAFVAFSDHCIPCFWGKNPMLDHQNQNESPNDICSV